MNVLQGLLSAVSPLSDGDTSDRLNYCFSTVGLVVASAFISGWSFVGSPIQCWFPAYYRGWWMEYALDYCYVQNTYFVQFTSQKASNHFDFADHMVQLPTNITGREEKQIGYYQWVPFILALQALLFYAPVVLWRTIYEGAGFKVRAICDTCNVAVNMDEASREKNMATVAKFLVQEHAVSDKLGKNDGRNRITTGMTVTFTYLFVKLLYVLNAMFQFCALRHVLGVDSYLWGLQVTQDLAAGREWSETGNFPRVTMCDYEVRVLGNIHRHSVQCVLMINMFNEKIFLVLWFWLAFMFAVSLFSFLKWAYWSFGPLTGRRFIEAYIQKIDPRVDRSVNSRGLLQQFVSEKLRHDGVFITRLVADNNGDMVTCSLLRILWNEFQSSHRPPPYPIQEPALLREKKISESDL